MYRRRVDKDHPRVRRVLGATVGGLLLVMGAAELAVRIDDDLGPLLFWIPTLWGGGVLILIGTFRAAVPTMLSAVLVTAGALVGLLPSAWTLVMPVLSIALVVLTFQAVRPDDSTTTLG
jgi:hypothetical protein